MLTLFRIFSSNSLHGKPLFMWLFALLAANAQAQTYIGINAGVATNKVPAVAGSIAFYRPAVWEQATTAGLSFHQFFESPFSVSGDLNYIGKAQRSERYGYIYEGMYSSLQRNYVQASVFGNGKVPISERLSLTAGIGAYAGYFLNGKWDVTHRDFVQTRDGTDKLLLIDYATISEEDAINLAFPLEHISANYEMDTDYGLDLKKDRRIDYGIGVNAGLQFRLGRFMIFSQYNYLHGLASLDKYESSFSPVAGYSPRKNVTHSVQVGLMFTLSEY